MFQIDEDLSKFIEDSQAIKKFKELKVEVMRALECKICRDIPRGPKVLVLCCNQILDARSVLMDGILSTHHAHYVAQMLQLSL